MLFYIFPLQMDKELKRSNRHILDILEICVLPRFYLGERELITTRVNYLSDEDIFIFSQYFLSSIH